MNFRVEFDGMEWDKKMNDCFWEKVIIREHRQIRLIEFKKGFESPGFFPCGHSGIVLDGAIAFNFEESGQKEIFNKGEIFYVPDGKDTNHKITNEADATVLFFEDV